MQCHQVLKIISQENIFFKMKYHFFPLKKKKNQMSLGFFVKGFPRRNLAKAIPWNLLFFLQGNPYQFYLINVSLCSLFCFRFFIYLFSLIIEFGAFSCMDEMVSPPLPSPFWWGRCSSFLWCPGFLKIKFQLQY